MLSIVIMAVGLAAAAPALPPASARSTVEAFHAALGAGNRDLALSYLDPRVVIFEQGGAELSRDEYAAEHLGADIGFLKSAAVKVIERTESVMGDTAWILTRTEATDGLEGRPVVSRAVETMVLRRANDRWTIVHIHWSSQRMTR